jgi:hypothetical protein
MIIVNPHLLYLDERAKFWAYRSVLVMNFYVARYIVVMFVTGVQNEAHYSLTSFCNEL